jgi:hypothetical protein
VIVIGLTGLIGAGKDTVADILVRDHGFTKMAFAAPIKRHIRELDPIVGTDLVICDCGDMANCPPEVVEVRLSDLYGYTLDDDEIKNSRYGEEVRRLWQAYGTEVFREEDDTYWISWAENDMLTMDPLPERVVFSDCRFPNEADWIAGLDYHQAFTTSVWQIARPGHEADPEAHSSEQHVGLVGEEITIHNDGTLEELAGAVGVALGYVEAPESRPMSEWWEQIAAPDWEPSPGVPVQLFMLTEEGQLMEEDA